MSLQLETGRGDLEGRLSRQPEVAGALGPRALAEQFHMTTLDSVRDAIPDYARDLKLNLGSVIESLTLILGGHHFATSFFRPIAAMFR